VCIIDQEKAGLRILREISESDVLTIADVVDECDRALVEHPEEAGRAAPVLYGGLSILGCRRKEDTALFFDERL